MKCKVSCDMNMQMTVTRKKATNAKPLGWPLMDSDSFNEHLNGRALAFVKNAKRQHMKAMGGHVDGMNHSRELSRF